MAHVAAKADNRSMRENTEKFTGRVAGYAQYRERYDSGLVLPLLRSWCGLLPQWTVADIGAGTGMLSDVFLANGNPVIAVEPNAEMREACARLHQGDAKLNIVNGTAEKTGLANASVDMISVGRALHWFDLESAAREFRRVLKPCGWVAVVAFGRSKDGREENEAYEELLRPYTRNGEGTHAGYTVYQQLEQVFAGGELRRTEISGEMHMSWDAVRGLTLSLSHAPLPGSAQFSDFEHALREYFARYERDGKVTLATRCWVNAGRFCSPA